MCWVITLLRKHNYLILLIVAPLICMLVVITLKSCLTNTCLIFFSFAFHFHFKDCQTLDVIFSYFFFRISLYYNTISTMSPLTIILSVQVYCESNTPHYSISLCINKRSVNQNIWQRWIFLWKNIYQIANYLLSLKYLLLSICKKI